MAMTKAEIQKRSDEKRGVKVKGIKMKLEDIALLESLSAQSGKTQAEIIAAALKMWSEKHNLPSNAV
ncbi:MULTISPECIES: hypothetical protein [Neisseria]|nr:MULTISPECIES: hypothetical protein [Neisseria]MBD0765103.1 hypothetical protein [Neisseria sp. RH3002v2f]